MPSSCQIQLNLFTEVSSLLLPVTIPKETKHTTWDFSSDYEYYLWDVMSCSMLEIWYLMPPSYFLNIGKWMPKYVLYLNNRCLFSLKLIQNDETHRYSILKIHVLQS